MQLKAKKTSARFLLCCLVAIVMEWPFAWSLISGEFINFQHQLSSTIAAHTMASLLMFFSFPKGKGWLHHSRNWGILFFFIVFFLPLFGILLCLILFYSHADNVTPEFVDDNEVFTDKLLPDQFQYKREAWGTTLGKSLDFIPLADVLEGHDNDLKRGAIEQLASMASSNSIKLLKRHSRDESSEIRFYITSAITKIKKSLDDEIEASKLQVEKNPDDEVSRLTLAKAYLRYAQSNLLEPMAAESYHNDTIYHLKSIISSHPKYRQAYQMLLDLYIHNKDWEHASEVTLDMTNENLLNQKEQTELLCEISYQTRRFDLLKKQLKTILKLKDTDQKWSATAQWWGVYK